MTLREFRVRRALRKLDKGTDTTRSRALLIASRKRIETVRDALEIVKPPDEHLIALCDHALEHIQGIEGVFVSFISDREQLIRAASGSPRIRATVGRAVPLPSSMCVHVVATDRPLIAPDTAREPLLSSCLVRDEFPAYIGYPIHLRGQVIGAAGAVGPARTSWGQAPEVIADMAASIERDLAARDALLNT